MIKSHAFLLDQNIDGNLIHAFIYSATEDSAMEILISAFNLNEEVANTSVIDYYENTIATIKMRNNLCYPLKMVFFSLLLTI